MSPSPPADRYDRQTRLPQVGVPGRSRIATSRAVVVGMGALGTVAADALVRAGVGHITVIDRDLVETSNLQRQTLYVEADVGRPKAVAAAERLAAANGDVRIVPTPADVDATNVQDLLRGADVVLDGTDNVQTRYLLNDACVRAGVAWVYAAALGTEGRVMAVVPKRSACLRCVFPQPPRPGELETCDTAGVLAMASGVAANLQAAAALRVLVSADAAGVLHAFDVWKGTHRTITPARDPDCPCCGCGDYEFLTGSVDATTGLCGRDAVQVRVARSLDLGLAAERFRRTGQAETTPFFVRLTPADGGTTLTAFADGRVIVQGTSNAATARSVVARYLGV